MATVTTIPKFVHNALATELIALSEQTRTAHDLAIDHEQWAVAEKLRELATVVAGCIATALKYELAVES